jgi:hypothetical protein
VEIQVPKHQLIVPSGGRLLPMRRHEYWRLMYRRNRYLEHAPEAELISRARDIISNATDLTGEGKIGLLLPEVGGAYWLETFSHLQEEMSLRGISFPAGFMKDASVPKPSFPVEPRAQRLVRELGPRLADHPYVVKLGKSKYLTPAFKEVGGAFRRHQRMQHPTHHSALHNAIPSLS